MMQIIVDDLTGPEIAELIREHLAGMFVDSPPESVHALDLEQLKGPDITFWSAWDNGQLLGCGALKQWDSQHGEVKSMRTVTAHLRKGVARAILAHLVEEARLRGYTRLSLETGSMESFEPARKLYESFGFVYCDPFADYIEDTYSVFMTKLL